jgi:hypothetical protein
MTPTMPSPEAARLFETARAELIEALVHLVDCARRNGIAESQAALDQIKEICADLDAAECVLLTYLLA